MRFLAPQSLDAALDALSEPGALALGGGTSLALLVRAGLVDPPVLVSLGGIPELAGVTERDGALVLGAATTLREIAADARVGESLPALAAAAAEVGNPRVRAVATLGGALAHADPRQDVPPALIAYGASARLVSPTGERVVPVAELATGFLETVIGEDELVTDVVVPVVPGRQSCYVRFTPASEQDYPLVSVAAAVVRDATGRVREAAVALGGATTRAVGVEPVVARLLGELPEPDVLADAAARAGTGITFRSDRNGSAAYREAVTEVLVRRALERCLS